MTVPSPTTETPTIGKLSWFNMKTGNGIAAVLGEDGIVRRYFITQSRILESPRIIEAGDIAEFCGATESKPGLLPVALGVRITKKTNAAPVATSTNGGRQ